MAIDRQTLKTVMLDNEHDVTHYNVVPRHIDIVSFPYMVFVGVRRAGKSFLLFQKIHQLLAEGHQWSDMLYIDFEDIRLSGFTADDLPLILDCHSELYGHGSKPILFLDEIQNITGWERFARNLADRGFSTFITGSNAKMLSGEILSLLGGRYMSTEVYPYSFAEYLQFLNVPHDERALLSSSSRTIIMKNYDEYFLWGGLPEAASLSVKRNYLQSVFLKIYLGDIVARNRIAGHKIILLLLKKLCECIRQPVSYNRLANTLSSLGAKISVPTVASYIAHAEDAWLILRLKNIASAFVQKETVCKYYFIDNGLISLQLGRNDSILLENLVAITLFRKHGYAEGGDRVFFYADGRNEVDFYVPDEQLAIQVAVRIDNASTEEREINALTKLPQTFPCKQRIIITYDTETSLTDSLGSIRVIPAWKWLLGIVQ